MNIMNRAKRTMICSKCYNGYFVERLIFHSQIFHEHISMLIKLVVHENICNVHTDS